VSYENWARLKTRSVLTNGQAIIVKRSKTARFAGAFYCLEVFPPSEIEDWTDDGDTALCPKCGIDSVLGSISGYPIERQFLKKMHDQWF